LKHVDELQVMTVLVQVLIRRREEFKIMDSRDGVGIVQLKSILSSADVIHIYGAGLNNQRPAHSAVPELKKRGWAVAPIHPKDGGATIEGFPIRPGLDDGVIPKVVVLFLAPERSRAVVRNLIVRFKREVFPLVWFQLGAEDEQSRQALDEMGAPYVENDCLVRFSERHELICENSPLPQQWCLQVASESGDGCSEWSVHSSDSASLNVPINTLEWVGSMDDLAQSNHTIPRYIRSLKLEAEELVSLVFRLSGQLDT
jgi:predicted CoA-binding protein